MIEGSFEEGCSKGGDWHKGRKQDAKKRGSARNREKMTSQGAAKPGKFLYKWR